MFKAGDMVVYGGTGVCRVLGVLIPEFAKKRGTEYYELEPVYESGTIYAPVDNRSIFMRYVMDKDKANEMIDGIPNIKAEEFKERSTQKLSEHYKEKLKNQDCEELFRVIISAHAKKARAEAANRKFGQIDKKFMKKAENLLYGELAVALDIDRTEVRGYIQQRIDEA